LLYEMKIGWKKAKKGGMHGLLYMPGGQ
jgi:hypothetical protein